MALDPQIPATIEVVAGSIVYRRGTRVRLRAGLEGPDAGLEGRLGTVEAIHPGDDGPSFLSVQVDVDPADAAAPLRHVFVVPAQVDLVED
jgi:hypothetical protein